MATFDPTSYKNDFAKENYDRVVFTVPKGRKADLKKVADAQGISLNRLIMNAIENCYNIDLSKKD